MYVFLTIIIGYVLGGCLHGSQIISMFKQVNMRKSGSKNAGATNATMLLGWKYGLIVAFIDVFKAIISFLLIATLLQHSNILFETQIFLLYVNALFVVIGHNFPITMKFKGGKGTASFLGFLLCLNWKFTFIAFCMFLMIAILTRYFVMGTLMAYVAFIFYTASSFDWGTFTVAVIFALLFLIKHIDNFKRIAKKKEMKISMMFHREAS